MKRRELQIVERLDRPAVTPVSIDVLCGSRLSLSIAIEQRRDLGVRLLRLRERADNVDQRRARGGANGRILLPNEFLRLSRPRHQLTVQTNPVRLELVPDSRAFQRRLN